MGFLKVEPDLRVGTELLAQAQGHVDVRKTELFRD